MSGRSRRRFGRDHQQTTTYRKDIDVRLGVFDARFTYVHAEAEDEE
jgi:hypothetical protein